MKIAILGSFTTDILQKKIDEILTKDSIESDWYISPFNQYRQEILNEMSGLKNFNPDIIILAVDIDTVLLNQNEYFDIIKSAAKYYSSSTIFIFNGTSVYPSANKLLEWNTEDSINLKISEFNNRLFQVTSGLNNTYLIDVDALIHKYGYDNIFDARFFYLAKSMFSSLGILKLAGLITDYLKAYLGKRKKCLVLDLDNTLWGGVLGEVGLENIKLSNDGEGKAFYDFQKNILKLYDTGIILAICSKNDKELVMEVLEKHPYMVLKKEHFAAYQINWNSKVQNLSIIANELNIGLDSLVFLDDSSFERESIRSALSQVAVPDMPTDFSDYPKFISELSYFETYKITDEDKVRGKLYADEKKREEIKELSASFNDFLFSLNITVTITGPNSFNIPRISQLTQKTNQFNLTTRRYTEKEIKQLSGDKDWKILSITAIDRLGDSGIVGVGMLKIGSKEIWIDNFLISCRVLGRGIEQAFLSGILKISKDLLKETVIAEFIQTPKNNVAKDFLILNGFIKKDRYYIYELEKEINFPEWIMINYEQ